MYRDLTKGSIAKGLLLFALPMIAGNLLQQLYNIADTPRNQRGATEFPAARSRHAKKL